jgi:GDSL-like Lipase/Acylhydrolase family
VGKREYVTTQLHNMLRREFLGLLPTLFGTRALSMVTTMPHIVLLGDSVFDNGAYVSGGPDVVRQLRSIMGNEVQVTLAAVDGSTVQDVVQQLQRVRNASHLVISAGGNDALLQSGVLDERVRSVSEALERVAAVQKAFERAYESMLQQVLERQLPTAVCTIYDPRYSEPMRSVGRVALSAFNDSITRQAFQNGTDIVDLRIVCDQDADFVNAVEPSVAGGAKIANAIRTFVSKSNRSLRSEVFTGMR